MKRDQEKFQSHGFDQIYQGSFELPRKKIPLTIFEHHDTKFRIIVCETKTPISCATFCLQTLCEDHYGLPHTLEHCKELVIFKGIKLLTFSQPFVFIIGSKI